MPRTFIIDGVAVGEDVVQIHLAEHGPQRRRRQLQRRGQELLDLEHGVRRRRHRRVHDRVDADRDVVVRDDLLRRDLDGARARIDDAHAVDAERQQQVDPRRRQLLARPPEPEHDRALVLLQDPHAGQQQHDAARDRRSHQKCQHARNLPPGRRWRRPRRYDERRGNP
jgi:hypothetical protein